MSDAIADFKRGLDLKEGDVIVWKAEQWLIEKAEFAGGGQGHGPGDTYPDGWQLTLRKMRDDRYDPSGEVQKRYASGCFVREVMLGDFTFVRTMRSVWVDDAAGGASVSSRAQEAK